MLIKETGIRTFFDFFNGNRDKRKLVIYGGAGSGKSHATAQWIAYSSFPAAT